MPIDVGFDAVMGQVPSTGTDPNHPNFPNPMWQRGQMRRRLSRLLMGGTEAMRVAAGSGGPVTSIATTVWNPAEYATLRAMPNVLPKETGETDFEYQIRRDRSVLAGFFHDAIDEHVGRAFHQPPHLLEDVPSFIRGEIEYVDVPVDDGADEPSDIVPAKRRIAKTVSSGLWENID